MTAAQYNEEKRKEAEYERLASKVISKFPWGKWYPLMIAASSALTKALPKRIALYTDGRPFVQYKGFFPKVIGTFLVPTHKVWAEDVAQKNWGKLVLDVFTLGQVSNMAKQTSNKLEAFDISPDEVTQIYKRKIAASDPVKAAIIKNVEALPQVNVMYQRSPNPFVALLQYMFRGSAIK